jgi:hypothetical protein
MSSLRPWSLFGLAAALYLPASAPAGSAAPSLLTAGAALRRPKRPLKYRLRLPPVELNETAGRSSVSSGATSSKFVSWDAAWACAGGGSEKNPKFGLVNSYLVRFFT